MRAGQLRHQITIKGPGTRVDDGAGGGSIVEPVIASDVRARIETLSGSDLFEARQFAPRVTHKITMRYIAGIKPAMKVEYDGRVFNIQEPINDVEERHRELQLTVEEMP